MFRKISGAVLAAALPLLVACAESDQGIANKIRVKIETDRDLSASQIEVTSAEKVVTISGTVGSAANHDRVIKLARDTEGVKDVKDQLTVATSAAGAMAEAPLAAAGGAAPAPPIADAVKARLAADQKVASDAIQVEAQGDTIILSGTVKSQDEKAQAVKVAQETQGVGKVEDRLTVAAS